MLRVFSWLFPFAFLGSAVGGERLLDFSGPVKATASSTYVESKLSNGFEFSPLLAVQADTTNSWTSCYLSKKEVRPWFRLEFDYVASIFNVWLGVRDGHASSSLTIAKSFGELVKKTNLSVYVSNSSFENLSSEQLCSSSLRDRQAIQLVCGSSLKGRFLYITIPSDLETFLSICSIILNRENGPPLPLNLTKGGATVMSGSFVASSPPELAIDSIGSLQSCSFLTGASSTWLRVDIHTVRYIRKVELLVNGSQLHITTSVGRSLRGSKDNTACAGRILNGSVLHWEAFICKQPVLGQFIYIEGDKKSMQICEVHAFYSKIMNIYSSVRVTASDQKNGHAAIWKPIDGVYGTTALASWKSRKSSQSWWRVELPGSCAITKVLIYPAELNPGRMEAMRGFAVYIGDSSVGNGSRNAICGGPWEPKNTTMIVLPCSDMPVGNYLYVAAADRSISSLSLNEVSVYSWEGPIDVNVTQVFPANFTMSWNRPSNSIPHYTVGYRKSNSNLFTFLPNVEADLEDITVHVTVMGLQPYTIYEVQVVFVNRLDQAVWKENLDITTKMSAPSAPIQVSTLATTDTSLKVSWKAPVVANGIIYSYQIFYKKRTFSMFDFTRNVTTSGTSLSAIITNLTPNTTYTVTVRAFTVSYGNLSIPSWGKTKLSTTPSPKSNTPLIISTEPLPSSAVPSSAMPSSALSTITLNSSEATSSNNMFIIIIGAAVASFILLLVIILIILVVLRKRSRMGQYMSTNTEMDMIEDAVEFEKEFIKPALLAVESEIESTIGSVQILKIASTGYPDPKVEWKCGGIEVPGDDKRFNLLPDGSLQISDVQERDAGLYQCTLYNKAGSSECQIKLRVCMEEEKVDPISLVDFERHVQELHNNRNHGFSLEFSVLDRNMCANQSTSVASLACNKSKNRYVNVLPYDTTRVILKDDDNVPDSDYVNASYVNAYGQLRGYIACQGPTKRTIKDFWRMIWQENVQTIAVVTNLEEKGKVKCSCYWPPLGKIGLYGAIVVSFEEELILSECTMRKFKLAHSYERDEKFRTVTQFHFTGWPDYGVPSYATSLLNFVKRVRSHHEHLMTQSPMVIHCSAGVGRSGTFIVIDYSLLRMRQENKVDIFNLIKELRMQRPYMVQSEEQYIFCHNAVLEEILCGDTSIKASDLSDHISELDICDPNTEKTGFQKQLELLDKVSPGRQKFSYGGGMKSSNASKNRSSSCIPPDESRVVLDMIPEVSDDSTYICASAVDGYHQKGMYITTQGPLDHTIGDFWRLVWECNIHFVVMLTQLEENEKEMSAQYWPSEGTTAEYDSMSVTLQDERQLSGCKIRKLNLTNNKSSGQRIITQFHYLSWPDGLFPTSPSQLLDMMKRLERAKQQEDNKSVVVMCGDGVRRCGMFCAISIILEMLKTEQVVDIFQVVKALRLHNPDFVTNVVDYKFCYNMAVHFLASFDSYSNFQLL